MSQAPMNIYPDEAMIREGSCALPSHEAGRRWGSLGISGHTKLALSCLAETLWPTRCIVCGRPGQVLCEPCMRNLDYIDQWMACPRCGAPFGRVQCTECNSFAQRSMPQWHLPDGKLPFTQCVSAVHFDVNSAHIVRGYKDAGEQRLAEFMAFSMACAVPPGWLMPDTCLSYIPASRKALSRRGFDHVDVLQQHLQRLLGLPGYQLLAAGRVHDQRGLGRSQRFDNMRGCFYPLQYAFVPSSRVILVDDVFTTGATLMSAAETLLDLGFYEVRCLTFARVY